MSEESKGGQLENDQVFKGLTRPPMLFGVSYSFVMLNFFFNMIAFILSSDLRIFLLAVVLHGCAYAYSIYTNEPLFLELFMMKIQKFNRCKNKISHGANSYDVY